LLFVQNIETTPNLQALKFVINEILLKRETRFFESKIAAEKDALAKEIFKISGVVSVFYTDKFITIEKTADTNWLDIQKHFNKLLRNFDKSFISAERETDVLVAENETETLQKIVKIIDKKIRPFLAGDGGGIDILEFKKNKLKIKYLGACGNCTSSINGTQKAIESLLRREINGSINVVSV